MWKYLFILLWVGSPVLSQTLEQRVSTLERQMFLNNRKDSLQDITLKTQATQISSLRNDSIKKTREINSLQRIDSLYKTYFTTQTNQILALGTTTRVQAIQITELQKINKLSTTGSLKFVKTGSLNYEFRQDTATKLREGNLTAYKWRQIQMMESKLTTVYNKVFPLSNPPPPPSNPPPIIIPPISNDHLPNRTITHPKFFPNN